MSNNIKVMLVILVLAGLLYGISRLGDVIGGHGHECAPSG